MTKDFSKSLQRVIAELNSSQLKKNYLSILKQAPGQEVIPMIKADGYGHGAQWVAQTLLKQKRLNGFGVATLEEGAQLRKSIRGRKSIYIFSGCSPWTPTAGRFCQKYHLTPILFRLDDLRSFIRGRWHLKLPYQLKFNTGMNRLGIEFSQRSEIFSLLKKLPYSTRPTGLLTHLALGENPTHPLSRRQKKEFEQLQAEFSCLSDGFDFHIANSAGIWGRKKWNLDSLSTVVRPGLALYGIPPWKGAQHYGIQPVLSLKARVTLLRPGTPGTEIGYGGIRLPKTFPRRSQVAILSAGYGDGISRLLSQKGAVWINQKTGKFIGRISMDLSAITCPQSTQVGDWAEILGPHIDPWKQAELAQTIPYELLTSVSTRVQRKYV